MSKDKRIQTTKAPLDIVQELLVSPEDMLNFLTAGAVELYALGVTEDICQPDVFRNAMHPLALAWNVEDEQTEHALAAVTEQCKAIAEDEDYDPEKSAFKEPSHKKILAIFATLTDTIVWLDSREDRLRIAELIYFLKDFWDIEGSLA